MSKSITQDIAYKQSLRRVPKVEVPGFFVGGGELQGEKRKESPMDSEHFRHSQVPFPCRKKGARYIYLTCIFPSS